MNEYLDITPEVADALANGSPVVAFETTVITHGLPFPRNLDVASAMTGRVRACGAAPAVIGILKGRIRVGMTAEELEQMAQGGDILKVSRRDLAFALATGRDGGTTVAGTMICARLAGISVFATGGLGGVHRGFAETLDVSADLTELAASPVAVICAGAKAILDLPRTLEYLETAGVPVVGYGTDAFPGFYMRDSGLAAPMRMDTPEDIARLMKTHWDLGMRGGLIVAQPAPDEVVLEAQVFEPALSTALADAARHGISGKALTPYLLDRIGEITGGDSIDANAALIENNADLAARIAVAYASGDARIG